MKIPKVINFCWFGGKEFPEDVKKCIESWKKFCPDYKIIKWDENNFDIQKYKFVKEAYEQKKWAFVTDVARLDIIYNNGGIYFDTDVELIKNIDDLLDQECFFGFESQKYVNTGIGFGAIKKNKIIEKNLLEYKDKTFSNVKNISSVACPIITSKVLEEFGFVMNGEFQKNEYCTLYPKNYFCPMNYDTGKIKITSNTYSIHHYTASWQNKSEIIRHKIEIKLNNILPKIFGLKKGKWLAHKISRFFCHLVRVLNK